MRPLIVLLVCLIVAPAQALAKKDPGLFATPSQCPGSASIKARTGKRERAMYCLIARARRHRHKKKLARSWRLAKAAQIRTRLIVRCNMVTAMPCGKPFSWFYEKSGYADSYRGWDAASLVTAVENFENYRPSATSIVVFRGMMRSFAPMILGRKWEHVGVDARMTKSGYLLWSMEFGRGGRR